MCSAGHGTVTDHNIVEVSGISNVEVYSMCQFRVLLVVAYPRLSLVQYE